MIMSKIYVNLHEYEFLIRAIEDAMLTYGELDSDSYDAAESLLKKLGYPQYYRDDIKKRLKEQDFRWKGRSPYHKRVE
jgi:hypothetical protein